MRRGTPTVTPAWMRWFSISRTLGQDIGGREAGRNRERIAEDFVGAGAEVRKGSIDARRLDGLNVREGGADWLGQRLSWEPWLSGRGPGLLQ